MRSLIFLVLASFLLSACVDHFAEREKFRPLREAAGKGDARAFADLQTAAEHGIPEAEDQLGVYYVLQAVDDEYQSEKEKTDYAAAIKWWSLASAGGNAPAQYNLGYLYDVHHSFIGIPSENASHIEAVKWYRKAAEQGDRASRYRLWNIWYRDTVNSSVRLRNSKGAIMSASVAPPPLTRIEALKWLRLAAEQGHVEAQLVLGALYADEDAPHWVERDYQKSYFWCSLAAKSGANIDSDKIAKLLTPEQRTLMDKRIKEWQPAPVPWPQPPS